MARLRQSWLPPAPHYADRPAWPHNSDTVETRTVNAAWNALFTIDLADFSFKALAKEVGVTPPALYHYFPTVSALGGELARQSHAKLFFEMKEDIVDAPPRTSADLKFRAREVFFKYLLFAQKRPRHFGLLFAPQFSNKEAFPWVALWQEQLLNLMNGCVCAVIDRPSSALEVHVFHSIIHGSGALAASGVCAPVDLMLETIERIAKIFRPGGDELEDVNAT